MKAWRLTPAGVSMPLPSIHRRAQSSLNSCEYLTKKYPFPVIQDLGYTSEQTAAGVLPETRAPFDEIRVFRRGGRQRSFAWKYSYTPAVHPIMVGV